MRLEAFWPLLLLWLPVLLWTVQRRSPPRLARSRRPLLLILRSTTILLLLFALMRPTWWGETTRLSTVFAVDVSRSLDAVELAAAIDWVETTSAELEREHTAVLAFADRPVLVEAAEQIRRLPLRAAEPGEEGDPDGLDRDATDLQAALELALRAFSPQSSKRLILLSDGRQTDGDVRRAIGPLRRAGVRVFPRTVRSRGGVVAWIESLSPLPSQVGVGEPIRLSARVASLGEFEGSLAVTRAGSALAQRDVALGSGEAANVDLEILVSDAGVAELELRLLSSSGIEDRLPFSLWLDEAPSLLYLAGPSSPGRQLPQLLERSGFRVSTSLQPAPLFDRLARFDAVILSNVPASLLEPSDVERLTRYVDDGGGLVFLAGPATYGEAGYGESDLEALLPVRFEIPESRRDLALVIALDKSYSMEGRKMELAKEASKRVVDILEDHHEFGLVAFDWNPYTVVPLQLAANRMSIQDSISRIQASAQTNFFPALETSFRQLRDRPAPTRHIILVSDGKSYPDEYERLLQRFAAADVTVSTVAVGEEADRELLRSIAAWGRGRAYSLADAGQVERILIDEVRIAGQDTLIEEPTGCRIVTPALALRGVDLATAPPLLGHVATRAKEGAETLLASERDTPLLARWRHGLGRVVVFTSDSGDRWASDWLRWNGYGRFWSQLVRQTLRRAPAMPFDFRVVRHGNEARISLDAIDHTGRYPTKLAPRSRVRSPTGAVRRVELEPIAPGVWEAGVALDVAEGAYRFELDLDGAESPRRTVHFEQPDELRPGGADQSLLATLAVSTGGEVDAGIEEMFERGESLPRRVPLWGGAIALALLCYLLDILTRRAPWGLAQR